MVNDFQKDRKKKKKGKNMLIEGVADNQRVLTSVPSANRSVDDTKVMWQSVLIGSGRKKALTCGRCCSISQMTDFLASPDYQGGDAGCFRCIP